MLVHMSRSGSVRCICGCLIEGIFRGEGRGEVKAYAFIEVHCK